MTITVLSPYDGSEVKVRPQDVGRAVKDKEGRILYVLEKSDGSGYYGAMTRAGGERDQQRAEKLESRVGATSKAATEAFTETMSRAQRSGGGKKKLILLLLIIAAAIGAAYIMKWPPFSS